MNKIIKFTDPNNTFVTSDTHFFHKQEFVWGKRGYKSLEYHNEGLLEKWNSKVKPNSTVIHLGDFFLNCIPFQAKEFIFRLNGHIYYLFGNHNSCMKDFYKESVLENFNINPNENEVYPSTWKTKVTFVGNILYFGVGKQMFVASHFPLSIWEGQNKNFVHINGHSHSGDKNRNPDCYTEGKSLDCGVDNFPYPMSISELMVIFNKKQYKKIDENH